MTCFLVMADNMILSLFFCRIGLYPTKHTMVRNLAWCEIIAVSNNGTITALSAGTTTIKVTTDNGVEASCTLKVQADAPQYANKLVRTTNYTSIKNQVKEINQNEAKELAAYMAFKDQQNATVGYRIPSTYESYFTIEVVSSDKEGSDWTWAHGIANSGLIKGNFYDVSNS